MKFSLRKTTGLQWIGFYLISLAALALLGWSEGALWAAGIVGGVALAIYWVAGMGWAATDAGVTACGYDLADDLNSSFSISSTFHE